VARPSRYGPEFKADALALWRASDGRRTFKDVAADLNLNAQTLRSWVRDSEGRGARHGHAAPVPAFDGDGGGELARLRADNARLLKAEMEWQLEREILRRAAQYFAKEMK
jgi:transposase